MVNFKSSGFDKGTGGKSGKFQFDCDGCILFTRRSINITNSFSFSLYNLPFYTVFRSRTIANVKEANCIIQITQISDRNSIIDCSFGNTWRVFGVKIIDKVAIACVAAGPRTRLNHLMYRFWASATQAKSLEHSSIHYFCFNSNELDLTINNEYSDRVASFIMRCGNRDFCCGCKSIPTKSLIDRYENVINFEVVSKNTIKRDSSFNVYRQWKISFEDRVVVRGSKTSFINRQYGAGPTEKPAMSLISEIGGIRT